MNQSPKTPFPQGQDDKSLDQPIVQHSGQGITGIVLGSLGICVLLFNVTLWLFFRAETQLTPFGQTLLSTLAVFNIIIIIFGLINSIRGLFHSTYKKTLPVIGLALNSFILLIYIIGIIIWVIKKY